MDEIYETEKTYVEVLEVLVHQMKPFLARSVAQHFADDSLADVAFKLDRQTLDSIFLNLDVIMSLHQDILGKMSKMISKSTGRLMSACINEFVSVLFPPRPLICLLIQC